MRTRIAWALAAAVLLGGCQMSARKQLHLSQKAFRLALEHIEEAELAGKISPEQSDRIDALALVGQKVLGQWEEAIVSGQEPSATLLEKFDVILAGLEAFLKEIEHE
ncbi:MAG: hypothetical protein OEV33_00285 [Armatimonadota bacterium]|nr:hypothetical protein [Armatimonadota bacterium]